ncbi:MAG: uncharacterized protein JWM05_3431 [Acidimicrobiales bacterium]|nr:uncharacterized protein [Acidimicrobiales bacterium]
MLPHDVLGARVVVGPVGSPPAEPVIDQRATSGRARVVADARAALLEVDGVGRFAILDGREVTVDAEGGDLAVEMWLHGTVAALVLGQQGQFALHASTVEMLGLGVAVTGFRGAGKSTTTLELRRRGHRLVTDDVSPVDDGVVTSFGRAPHVAVETAELLGIVAGDLGRTPGGKLMLPAPAGPPIALGAVIELRVGSTAEVDALTGARAATVLAQHTYRVELVRQLWPAAHFRWVTDLANRIQVSGIDRPADDWTVPAVADAIEAIAESVVAPPAP